MEINIVYSICSLMQSYMYFDNDYIWMSKTLLRRYNIGIWERMF